MKKSATMRFHHVEEELDRIRNVCEYGWDTSMADLGIRVGMIFFSAMQGCPRSVACIATPTEGGVPGGFDTTLFDTGVSCRR
jgi:hypothetical protein